MKNLLATLFILLSNLAVLAQTPSFSVPLEITESFVCKGGAITLTAGTTDTDTFILQVLDGGTTWTDLSSYAGATTGNISITFPNYTFEQTFRLKITNATSGNTAFSSQVSITPQEPVINFSPIDLTGCLGDDAFFKVGATGIGTLSYQWEISEGGAFAVLTNNSNYKNVTTNVLTVDGLIGNDDGDSFRCVVSDANGCKVTSASGSLGVGRHSDPSPTASVANSFCEGGEANFFANNVIGKVLSYQWGVALGITSSYNDLSESTNYQNVNSSQLTIAKIKADERNFRLKVEFEEISMDDTGSPMVGSCIVSKTRRGYIINPRPSFMGTLTAQNEACDEGKVTLEIAGGSGNYNWYADTTMASIGNGTLFETPDLTSTTKFFVATEDANSCESIYQEIEAVVNPLPVVSSISATAICPAANSFDISFSEDDGNPSVFSITAGTRALAGFESTSNASFAGSSISIPIPSNAVSATYDFNLVFKNTTTTCESVVYPVVLTIKQSTVITQEPTNQTACEGSSANFEVVATGEGTLTYQWYYEGGIIPGAESPTLTISNASASNVGAYYCRVNGECGAINSSAVRFDLSDPTTIVTEPIDVELCAGNSATFTIDAAGGDLSYEWFQNDNPVGSNSNTLILNTVPFSDNGSSIYCKVTGQCGVVNSKTVSLKVEDAPPIPTSVAQNYCQNEVASVLTASLSNSANSLIWYDENLNILANAPTPLTGTAGVSTFFVSEKSPGACEGGKAKIEITVNPTLIANLSATSVNICESGSLNASAELAVSVSGGNGIYEYSWKKVGSNAVLSMANQLTVSSVGAYYVIVGSATCGDSVGVSIVNPVGTLVDPKISIDGINFPTSVSVCPGGNLSFQSIFSGADITSEWFDGTTSIGTSNPLLIDPIQSAFTISTKNTKTVSGFTCESETASLLVNLRETPSVSLDLTGASCTGNTDGRLTITPTGSLQPYTYAIGTGDFQSSPVFENLAAGDYDLIVKNSQSCVASYPFSILTGSLPVIVQQPVDQYNCDGNTVTFESEIGNYTSLQWQKKLPSGDWESILGETSLNLRLTRVGNQDNPNQSKYRLLATNGSCELTSEIATLHVSDFTENLDNQKVCLGNDFSFAPPAIAGVAVNYEWEERQATSSPWLTVQDGVNPNLSLPNRQANQDNYAYRVSVTFDLNGSGTCKETSDLGSLEVRSLILNETVQNPTCFGQNNGLVSLSIAEGEAPYSYSINSQSFVSNNEFTGLAGGSYTFAGRDGLGCEVSKNILLTDPDELIIDRLLSSPVSCNGLADGAVDINAVGGTGVLTYTWSNGANPSALFAGAYSVTVSDQNACSVTATIQINEPSEIVISLNSSTASTCNANNGTLDVSASGGTGNLLYRIDDGDFQNTGLFENLSGGTHTIEVKDQLACSVTKDFEIDENRDFEIDGIESINESCDGLSDGSITVNQLGTTNLLYALDDGTFANVNTFQNLGQGTYLVKVRSEQGCEWDSLITIESTPYPSFDSQPTDQTNCDGNTITFSASVSDFSHLIWQKKDENGNWISLNGQEAESLRLSNVGNSSNPHNSEYRLQASNNTCVLASREVKLNVNSVEGSFLSSAICEGGSATLDLAELNLIGTVDALEWQSRIGTSGAWTSIPLETGSQIIVSPTVDTYYRCKIDFLSSSGTCVEYGSSSSGTRVEVIVLTETTLSGSATLCEGEETTLTASGCNGTVIWSDTQEGEQIQVSPVATATYTAICAKENCEKVALNSVEVTVSPGISALQITASKSVVCFGEDPVILQASACSGEVIWSNEQVGQSINVFPDGYETYSAICRTETCTSPVSNSITILGIPNVSAGEIEFDELVACSSYNPSTIGSKLPPSFGVENLDYTINWFQSENCVAPIAWTLVPEANSLTYNPPTMAVTTCFKRTTTAFCGTFDSNIITISLADDPAIEIAFDKTQICSNEVFQLTATTTGGAGVCEISWQKNERSNAPSSSFWEDLPLTGEVISLSDVSNPNTELSPIYFRAIIDCEPSSCNKATSEGKAILVEPGFDFDFSVPDTTICSGNDINISVENCGGEILWDDLNTDPNRIFVPLVNTIYTATCTSICGSVSKSVSVNVIPGIEAPISTTPLTAVIPEGIQFSAIGQNLRWYTEDDFSVFSSTAPFVTSVGEHTFWVSQYDGQCESPKLAITINVYEPLRIVSQTDDQYDCAGNSVTFGVEAVGVGQLAYTWLRKRPDETEFSYLKEDDARVRNVFSPYLTVSNVGRVDNPNGTEFKCQIIDQVGTLTTATRTLYANVLEGNLPSLSSCVGSNFDYNLDNFFTIIGDVVSYQWQKRNEDNDWVDLQDNEKLRGTSTKHLLFSDLTQNDAGRYRCSVAFNTGGFGCVENTDLSTFEVGTYPNQPVVQDENYCQFQTPRSLRYRAESGLDERWYFDPNQPLETATSRAPTPDTDIAGVQRFWVSQISDEGCESPKQELKVFVNPEPNVPKNTTPAYVDEGQLLTFTAQGENLRWFRTKTTRTYATDNPKHLEIGEYKYYVAQVSQFSCISERTLIESSIVGNLGFIQIPKSLSECEGNALTFESKAKGKGDITYQWFRKQPDAQEFVAIEGAIQEDLRISDAGENDDLDGSFYLLEIADSTGKVRSEPVQLVVNSLTGRIPDIKLCAESSFTLDLTDLSIKGQVKNYQLQKDLETGWETILTQETPDFNFEEINILDQGRYRLRVEFLSEITSVCPRTSNVFDVAVLPAAPSASLKTEPIICTETPLESLAIGEPLRFFNEKGDEISTARQITKGYLFYELAEQNGCKRSRDSIQVEVLESPVLNLFNDHFITCLGEDFDLSDLGENIEYNWYKDGVLLAQKPIVSSQTEGSEQFQISILAANSCESERKPISFKTELCVSNQVVECASVQVSNLDVDNWNYIKDNTGGIIIAIHPKGQNLGDFTLEYQLASNARKLESEFGTTYLPRYFKLKTELQGSSPIDIRFYFSSSEIDEHLDIVPFEEQNEGTFSIVNYNGENADCELTNNDNYTNGKASIILDDAEPIYLGNGSAFFQVRTSDLGEFGITANSFQKNKSLNVNQDENKIFIQFEQTGGVRPQGYLVEKSYNEVDWIPVGDGDGSVEDQFLINGTVVYRLVYIDADGVRKIVGRGSYFIENQEPRCFTFPNPVSSINGLSLFVANIDPSTIELIDLKGQMYPVSIAPQNDYFYTISLPFEVREGQYSLIIKGAEQKTCTWKIIRK